MKEIPNTQDWRDYEYIVDTDTVHNKFIGTWKYQSADTLVVMQLDTLHKHDYGDNFYLDTVKGNYRLVVNGQELINTMNTNVPSPSGDSFYILFNSIYDQYGNVKRWSRGFLEDPDRPDAGYDIYVDYHPGSMSITQGPQPPRLEVGIIPSGYITLGPDPSYCWHSRLPWHFFLTKD